MCAGTCTGLQQSTALSASASQRYIQPKTFSVCFPSGSDIQNMADKFDVLGGLRRFSLETISSCVPQLQRASQRRPWCTQSITSQPPGVSSFQAVPPGCFPLRTAYSQRGRTRAKPSLRARLLSIKVGCCWHCVLTAWHRSLCCNSDACIQKYLG